MSYDARHKDWDVQCKVYVGNLIKGVTEGELKDLFLKYGALKNVWVARLPPGFAFVEFEDPRDAEDACKELDGT
jgi:RNA recognition motif-containing protein